MNKYYEKRREKLLEEWKLKNKYYKDETGRLVRNYSEYKINVPFADKTTYIRNYMREYRLRNK